jgi:photosystem II stability/assembly factor-like uncharacterized protein
MMEGDARVPEGVVTGLVYALAASPDFARDGICFAACATGLYRSGDGGATWQSAYGSLDLALPLTTAVAVAAGNRAVLTVFAGVHGGILRSTDGGATWEAAVLRTPPPLVSALALSPDYAEDGILFAATMEDGVFRSGDRGGHWAAWNFGLLDLNILALAVSPAFAGDETVFAATESGIFRSTNGGRAWQEVAFSADLAPVISLAVSPGYATDGVVFAGTESYGLFSSLDGGSTWQRLGLELAEETVNAVLVSPGYPANRSLLALLGGRPAVSRDGGLSWNEWPGGHTRLDDVTALAAPQGLGASAPLLAARAGGTIVRL